MKVIKLFEESLKNSFLKNLDIKQKSRKKKFKYL